MSKKHKPIPLVVSLNDEIISGKSHCLRQCNTYPWGKEYDYTLPDKFDGVEIDLYSWCVEFFCGAIAVGDFVYTIHTKERLTKANRSSIYRRIITALRRHVRSRRSGMTQCLVIGDHVRTVGPSQLSLWEMGHVLPCLRTGRYTNSNSRNNVKLFVFEG